MLSAILLFTRLGARALWASEFRWAEIAREMILTHNYFWPTINGHLYYDKPLGSYWLVVAATYVTGGMNEAAARLPSALAGLIAVALVGLLGRRLYNLKTGVAAAAILATSFSFVFFARLADADVETVAGELAALTLFWSRRDRPHGNWIFLLWLIMALTSLTKGLLGFVLPILVIGVYCTIGQGWRPLVEPLRRGRLAQSLGCVIERNRWFFNWRTLVAAALGGVIYYAPFAISHAMTGSSQGLYMVYRENVERYFAPFDHKGPIYLYCYVIFILMAPWSAFLPAALIELHAVERVDRDRAASTRFVLVFFWAVFLFFTLSGSRRSYYLLPILPAGALLIARLLTAEELRSRAATAALGLGCAIVVAIVTVSALALIPPRLFMPRPYNLLPPAPARGIFALCWMLAMVTIAVALRRFSPTRVFAATAVSSWLVMFYLFVFAYPAGDQWRGEKQFDLTVRSLIGAETDKLALFRSAGSVYYLDLPQPVPNYNTPRDLQSAIRADRVRWLILRTRDLATLPPPYRVVAREAVFPWDSDAHRRNAIILVRLAPSP
ncbi:MAG TPA: glycosyltransferase family 39 protein [Candidatus Binataceae bacterium]|nr:glycosyltransferase family 39 protein [Candidatus Binataceae bacterium]